MSDYSLAMHYVRLSYNPLGRIEREKTYQFHVQKGVAQKIHVESPIEYRNTHSH